ncbi:DUF1304 domain-containing protein [Cytobacillus sp. IB215665]|uniref:DUF1304 domain-containing protein n=1 Tax=Cytobacillus sp. IB215665 TaxID=3097357 RepID=UPI002A0BBCF4|nr:DUF1304 domain-containing protein [Cytobacillus sp. IB215665]MDX8366813.1 DUF1304 domain-containing protein [Cytobacillus sp. IB215665]
MELVAIIFVLIVAFEHIYIMLLEMFYSTSRTAQKTFGVTKDVLEIPKVKILFANQGLYNGFLAAGLFWGLFFVPDSSKIMIQLFFLICVIIASIFGALTANKGIFIKQGTPAILAVIFILLSK